MNSSAPSISENPPRVVHVMGEIQTVGQLQAVTCSCGWVKFKPTRPELEAEIDAHLAEEEA